MSRSSACAPRRPDPWGMPLEGPAGPWVPRNLVIVASSSGDWGPQSSRRGVGGWEGDSCETPEPAAQAVSVGPGNPREQRTTRLRRRRGPVPAARNQSARTCASARPPHVRRPLLTARQNRASPPPVASVRIHPSARQSGSAEPRPDVSFQKVPVRIVKRGPWVSAPDPPPCPSPRPRLHRWRDAPKTLWNFPGTDNQGIWPIPVFTRQDVLQGGSRLHCRPSAGGRGCRQRPLGTSGDPALGVLSAPR